MEKILILPFLAVLFLATAMADQRHVETTVPAGSWVTMHSSILDEQRAYGLRLPTNYATDTEQTYPVIYVLDGDEHRLRAVGGIVDALSKDILEEQIPDAIVVTIPNTNRTRDLTPTHTLVEFGTEENPSLADSGGGPHFLRFLEQELVAYIDRTYRTDGTRLIIGESFGGLLAAHALIHKPGLFTHYLIIDATYIWDNGYLRRELAGAEELSGRVYVTLANNQHFGEIGQTNLEWGREFAAGLAEHGVSVRSQYFEDENHGTVALPSWYYGLRFLLGGVE